MTYREPGLRRTGPNPWDFEFHPDKGQKIAFADANGKLTECIVTDFNKDYAESGEMRIQTELMPPIVEVVIRKWGENWHVHADGESTTTGTFADALQWAAGALEPGGPPIQIRWGTPVDGTP